MWFFIRYSWSCLHCRECEVYNITSNSSIGHDIVVHVPVAADLKLPLFETRPCLNQKGLESKGFLKLLRQIRFISPNILRGSVNPALLILRMWRFPSADFWKRGILHWKHVIIVQLLALPLYNISSIGSVHVPNPSSVCALCYSCHVAGLTKPSHNYNMSYHENK